MPIGFPDLPLLLCSQAKSKMLNQEKEQMNVAPISAQGGAWYVQRRDNAVGSVSEWRQ